YLFPAQPLPPPTPPLFPYTTLFRSALPDNVAFVVDLPHRKSFSPDAAYYVGPPLALEFIQGAPVFAVEVRSKSDYGPRAERAMRSEEHTSELQSRFDLVCRLLLEKK